tara:strand:- start:2023 stop:2265 length:243 start_codon:yes stop_codon:yes gene_type:complete
MKNPNYFLYYVSKGAEKKELTPGGCGIGRTSLSPGVHDARWGTMMVIPYEYVWKGGHGIYGDVDCPDIMEKILLSYFGRG